VTLLTGRRGRVRGVRKRSKPGVTLGTLELTVRGAKEFFFVDVQGTGAVQ
jgi:hypothetical protein